MFWARPKSSRTPIDAARDVVLSIEITSLPVGGTITLIAWGSPTRRNDWRLVMPSDVAASTCPSSTEMMPARAISAMYAASLRPSPRMAAEIAEMTLADALTKVTGRKGSPNVSRGYNSPTSYQKKICTYTGVPRKNHVYTHAGPDRSRFPDNRRTARNTPRTMPMSIAAAVNSNVSTTPWSISDENIQ